VNEAHDDIDLNDLHQEEDVVMGKRQLEETFLGKSSDEGLVLSESVKAAARRGSNDEQNGGTNKQMAPTKICLRKSGSKQNAVWVIKEKEEESKKADLLRGVGTEEELAPGEEVIKGQEKFLEDLSKEEEVAPDEKVIKEQGDDSGGRIQRTDKMGAVGESLSKVVANALEHLIEEHDYTNTRTWVKKGNLEKEGGVVIHNVKQESNEEWEDPSRWQFVTAKKSKETVGSKIVDKLEVGQEVKMSAHLDKAAEEIVDDFYAVVEKELAFERKVEHIFSQHAEVIQKSAEEDAAQNRYKDADLKNQTEKIPKPAEKGSSIDLFEVSLKQVKERSGLDMKKVLEAKADIKVHEDENSKTDVVLTEYESKEQGFKDCAAFLDCTGCLQSVAVEKGVFSCQNCEGFRLCSDCKEIGARWWVGGGCPAPRSSSMPVHDLVKVTQDVELTSCPTSRPNQSQERHFPDNFAKPDFRSEEDRLASFDHWSVRFIKPADLAKAGFYSLKNLDKCRCAFCHSRVEDWVEGDQPMKEHAKLCPDCPFVLGREVGNVPITWLSAIRELKENQGEEDQVKEKQVNGNTGKQVEGEKARKVGSNRVKRSRTVGGRVDLQKLMSKEEGSSGYESRSSEYESRAVDIEACAVKLNNNEENWEELQTISQRELLEDPDFVPFKPKKPRKSAPPIITPIAPVMLKKSTLNVAKESSPEVPKNSSPSVSKKTIRKSERLTGEEGRVADTRLPLGPSHKILWNLLVALLRSKRRKQHPLLQWTDVSTLQFQIRQARRLARLWSKVRGEDMSWEQAKQVLLHYESRGLLCKVNNKNVWQFLRMPRALVAVLNGKKRC